jgi:hypothetical protein
LQRQRKQRQPATKFCVRPEPAHHAPIIGPHLLYYNILSGKRWNEKYRVPSPTVSNMQRLHI